MQKENYICTNVFKNQNTEIRKKELSEKIAKIINILAKTPKNI